MSKRIQKDKLGKNSEGTRKGVSRRSFMTTTVAAGAGGGLLAKAGPAQAQMASHTEWDYEADVVIAGGGCAGLTAAIRARDLGASVIVIDQNYDLGGRMLHSGAFLSLGGGDAIQKRDMAGESDAEGFITVEPREDPRGAGRFDRASLQGRHRLVDCRY